MGIVRRATALALFALLATIVPRPAMAVPVGDLAFQCEMVLSSSPSPGGGGATCEGTASGVMVDLPPAACIPSCPLRASLIYDEPCLVPNSPVPPLVGNYAGDIVVSGSEIIGTFQWLRVGAQILFVPPGSLEGSAEWVPLQVGFGTCQAPAPLIVKIVGAIS